MNKNSIVEREKTSFIVITNPNRPGIVVIDTADLPEVTKYNWHINRRGYVATGRDNKTILLHRLLMGFPPCVDHKDGDMLNNSRSNLRVATRSQNMGNRKMNKNNTSGLRGVQRFRDRWKVCLGTKYLGVFLDEVSAAKAYDKAAREYFGEFARLNFPDTR